MYDDTPLCSSLRDEVLESLTSHNIFKTKTLKDEYYEQKEGSYILGCDTSKKDSLITNIEGSVDLDTWENTRMKEEHSEFSHDHSESYHLEPHKVNNNEYIEKHCCEKLDVMRSVEYQSQPSSSHIYVPYVLEQPGAYTTSYYLISLDDHHDGVVDLPHHLDLYISAI